MDKENNTGNEIKDMQNIKSNDVDNNSDDWKVVEETKSNGSGILKALGMILIILVVLVGMLFGGMKLYDLSQSPKEKPLNTGQSSSDEEQDDKSTVDEEETRVTVDEAELESIYTYVHHMTNTIITADDGNIRGTRQITHESIDEALSFVKGVDDYLYTEINKWKQKEFANAVDVHNYVWNKLDGQIGKASNLNDEAIESVKTNL